MNGGQNESFKMKSLTLVVFAVVLAVALARPDSKYTTKYDNIDLDQILKNDRLMKNYVDCLLEKGRCTPDGQELKSKFFLTIYV